jgi:hypothetical protein
VFRTFVLFARAETQRRIIVAAWEMVVDIDWLGLDLDVVYGV